MPGVRVPPRRRWPKSKRTRHRVVAPETAGSSPAGHTNSPQRVIRDQRRSIPSTGRVRLPHPPPRAGGAIRKRSSPARRRLRVRVPHGPRPADVAQLVEARRSDRRQCEFESRRQYPLDVAQWQRTGFGSRGLEVRVLPSRPFLPTPMRGGGTGTTSGSEPGAPGSNPGLAAIRRSLGSVLLLDNSSRPDAQAGVPSEHVTDRSTGSNPVPGESRWSLSLAESACLPLPSGSQADF